MRQIGLGGMVCIILLASGVLAQGADAGPATLDALGMKVSLPAGWKKTNEGAQGPEGIENIGVSADDSAGLTLDEFANATVGVLGKQMGKFTQVASEDIKLGGSPARVVTYTCEVQGVPMKLRTYFAIVNTKAYSLTYGTTTDRYDGRQDEIKAIESGIRFQ